MKIVLIVLGVLAGVGLLVIGGCAAFVWFVLGSVEDAVQAELEAQPLFVEKVGTVESLDLDFAEDGSFVFTGTKASGRVEISPDGGETADSKAIVTLESGEVFEVPFSEEALERRIEGQFGGKSGAEIEVTPSDEGASEPVEGATDTSTGDADETPAESASPTPGTDG